MAVRPSDIASISEECLFLFTASTLHLPYNNTKSRSITHVHQMLLSVSMFNHLCLLFNWTAFVEMIEVWHLLIWDV